MQYIAPDVATICTGIAASMGAVLMCAGTKGKRTALKHSRVMIHQPLGGAQGQATDMEITVKEIIKLKKELYEIIADHSGQKFNKVEKDSERDFWMTAQEAKEYGMIDEVLDKQNRWMQLTCSFCGRSKGEVGSTYFWNRCTHLRRLY